MMVRTFQVYCLIRTSSVEFISIKESHACSSAWVLVYSVLYMLDTVRDKFLGLAGLTCGIEYYNSYGYHAQKATLEMFFCTPSMLEGLGRLLDSLLLMTFTTGQ